MTQKWIKYCRSLHQKKYRDRETKFLIEGRRLCEEALESDFTVERFWYCPSTVRTPLEQRLIERFQQRGIPVEEITQRELEKISQTVTSQGVVALVRKRQWSWSNLRFKERALVLGLDRISDPGNLGTILRTADWFGVDGVFLSPGCVELYNPKVVRATMGSLFHLPILEEVDLVQSLQQLGALGFKFYAADVRGRKAYDEITFPPRKGLIVGGEITAVSPEIKKVVDETLRIERVGRAESLNVSVATGILLARMVRDA